METLKILINTSISKEYQKRTALLHTLYKSLQYQEKSYNSEILPNTLTTLIKHYLQSGMAINSLIAICANRLIFGSLKGQQQATWHINLFWIILTELITLPDFKFKGKIKTLCKRVLFIPQWERFLHLHPGTWEIHLNDKRLKIRCKTSMEKYVFTPRYKTDLEITAIPEQQDDFFAMIPALKHEHLFSTFKQLPAFKQNVNHALALIKAIAPCLYGQINNLIDLIVLTTSCKAGLQTSFSSRECIGIIFCSNKSRLDVLECLIHEYGHNELNTILQFQPITPFETDTAILYSPWRDDPRPMLGLFHAAYVFTKLLIFYRHALLRQELIGREAVDFMQKRIKLLNIQLELALLQIRGHSERLNPLGITLLVELEEHFKAVKMQEHDPQAMRQALEHANRWQKTHQLPLLFPAI